MPPCQCAFGAQTNLRLIPSPSSCLSPLRNTRFGEKTYQIFLSHAKTTSSIRITRIRAIEPAAQQQQPPLDLMDNKLKIAIVGSDYSNVATHLGVSFFSDLHDLCKQNSDVIVLCTSILSTEAVLRAFPFEGLKRSTLFVDVLSVKEAPRNLFLRILPPEFDILCTHPMFGPQSGKHCWNGLTFVYDKVRIRDEDRCNRFLHVFDREDCDMVNMPCHEHDKWEAESQFITHFIGRVLQKLSLESTPINTKGYEALLELVRNTSGDSFDLFNGLFMYNKNALEQLERIDMAFESVKKQLFGELHSTLRKQLFGTEVL
ncbi:arogenate dehydrogenase (NADP(+)) [Ranunculus cassubicifolius]